MYALTQDLCGAAGMAGYEVSNHARVGAESRHNLIYWRAGDYAGIGPGAHGRLTLGGARWASDTLKAPLGWLRQVETTGNGDLAREAVPLEEQAAEYLMMSLRLSEGTDLARYRALSGVVNEAKIRDLEGLGMVTQSGERLSATPQGRMVLNAVLRELLA